MLILHTGPVMVKNSEKYPQQVLRGQSDLFSGSLSCLTKKPTIFNLQWCKIEKKKHILTLDKAEQIEIDCSFAYKIINLIIKMTTFSWGLQALWGQLKHQLLLKFTII